MYAIEQTIHEKKLWAHAEVLTPTLRCDDYTQAIMDLGATVCTRSKPRCEHCPLSSHCLAHQQNIVTLLPVKKTSRTLPKRAATFLILQNDNNILLWKRPPFGIWGGLWSLPQIDGTPDENNIRNFAIKINVTLKIFILPDFAYFLAITTKTSCRVFVK